MNAPNEVTVIGLGAMGSALAATLLRGGYRVTIWNRTKTKAEQFEKEGANLAPDPASAVAASPITIVCVDSYEVTNMILSSPGVRSTMSGRVLVQLSTGIPSEARDGERWAHDSGAAYLDGSIMAYPEHMGTAEAVLLLAGPNETFRKCEPLLRSLAGGLMYVGEKIGSASALDCATLSMLLGAMLGAIHGARICEVEGLRVDEFSAMATELLPVLGEQLTHLGGRIQTNDFANSSATLETYAGAAMRLVQQAALEGQMNEELPEFASAALAKGIEAGFGGEDLAALIKTLRIGT